MADVRARELRNELSDVLRRVESGERMRITLRGRPVADLVPVTTRPTSVSWAGFAAALGSAGADTALLDELAQALPDDTSAPLLG